MKLNQRDLQILQHIDRYCNEVDSTIEKFGKDKDLFMQDFVYRNAVSMPIFQIGELANHLSQDFYCTTSRYHGKPLLVCETGLPMVIKLWIFLRYGIPLPSIFHP